jgi:hypothetical protein
MDSLSKGASESLFFIENGAFFRLLRKLISLLEYSQKTQKFLFSVALIFGWAPVKRVAV